MKKKPDDLPMNCLSVFDHFVGLALKGLKSYRKPDCGRKKISMKVIYLVCKITF